MAEPWSRKEVIGQCVLYCGDAADIVPLLPKSGSIITDPPYGIKHKRGRCGDRGKGVTLGTFGIVGDDKPFDPTPLLQWPCILWGADNYCASLPKGRWLVWDKTVGGGAGDFSQAELAWFSRPGAVKVFRHLWMGVQRASEVGERRLHPTQKPVALLEWCLDFFPDAAVILDPYMGSAPTALAAIRQQRNFIGIEIDPQHFETACDRIAKAYAQPDIFIEQERKAVQEPLFPEAAA